MQLLVVSILGDQFVMASTLHDSTLMQDANLVCVLDGAQAMGDSHGGTCLHQLFEGVLYQSLTLGIECGCRFVEDEDRRILQDGTGDADTLALTSRKATTTITDIGVEAFFRLGDKLVGIGNLGSVGNLLVCGICLAKADVVLEGSIEKNSLLVDVTEIT